MADRLANRAEHRRAYVDAGETAADSEDGAAALIRVADELAGDPHQHPAAKPGRRHPDQSAAQRPQGLHRPFSRVLPCARGDPVVRRPFLPQEAQDRIQRRQSDGSFAQPFGVEPVFVEGQPHRQDIGNSLVKAGDQDAADSGIAHRRGRPAFSVTSGSAADTPMACSKISAGCGQRRC